MDECKPLIAGLVKGASTGAGLGNNFLSHIKAVDGIMHVMRAFEAGQWQIAPVPATPEPLILNPEPCEP